MANEPVDAGDRERAEQWERVNALFHVALARESRERAAFLATQCGTDGELRAEVESLLPAHEANVASVSASRLGVGTRVGDYEVMGFLAAGAMGEVYRARDTKLGREAALKILPPAFLADPDRRARFEREARVLASLNHPNIATIYGLEHSDVVVSGFSRTVVALALELVEGETLAERIARSARGSGRPSGLRIDDALRIAKQIAEALEAAHEQGIIHRDLKPANIKLTRDGVVKVLDFGLAKLSQPHADVTVSPAATGVDLTGVGVLVGTPAYMSPEQVRGEPVDKRTDIWAFGCVLYELLVGKPAFNGSTVGDVLARVLERDPDWGALPTQTPPATRLLLRRAFEKDPRNRLRDIGEARVQVGHRDGEGDERRERVSSAPRRRLTVHAAVAIGLLAVAGVVALRLTGPSTPSVSPPARFTIGLPSEAPFESGSNRSVVMSADGTHLLYLAGAAGVTDAQSIFVRRLDALDAVRLPDTLGARVAFFSPNGQSIGFITRSELKTVPITGGTPRTLYRGATGAQGAVWSPDDTIIFSTNDETTGLLRIPAGGGELTVLTKPDRARDEQDHVYPSLLPGNRAVVFTINPPRDNQNNTRIAVLDLNSGQYQTLMRGEVAEYLSSGHLLYQDGNVVRAVRFDPAQLTVLSEPVTVPDLIPVRGSIASVSVSGNGTLAYLRNGTVGPVLRTLVWIDRHGRQEPIPAPPKQYGVARLSPDGAHAAVDVRDDDGDIWTWDFTRRTLARLTFDGGARNPIWSPDGERIVYEITGGDGEIFSRRADGAGSAQRLFAAPGNHLPKAFIPDGKGLIVQDLSATRGNDLLLLIPGDRPRYEPLINSPSSETNPAVSPDGRWIAYSSNESGRPEVYVQPYPAIASGRWQVSTDGGNEPLWSHDGRELFYLHDRMLVSVNVRPSLAFQWDNPVPLVDVGAFNQPGRRYDVSSDGQRFLLIKEHSENSSGPPAIVVVTNWFEELKRLVPTGNYRSDRVGSFESFGPFRPAGGAPPCDPCAPTARRAA